MVSVDDIDDRVPYFGTLGVTLGDVAPHRVRPGSRIPRRFPQSAEVSMAER